MTSVSSSNLISSEVYVISKSSSQWEVEKDRVLVVDVLESTKENCRLVMIQTANGQKMVKDNTVFIKRESALKEIEFLNSDKFEDIINYSKDFDWSFKKGDDYKYDKIVKKFRDVKISINRNGAIKMNDEVFKSNATYDYMKNFINFVK